jgi:hypothetical protein
MTNSTPVAPWRAWTVTIAAVILWVAFIAQFVGESDRGWSVWLMLVAAVLMTVSAGAMLLRR